MKKSIFYLLVFGLVTLYVNANAQDVAIGVRGGVSIPNLTGGSSLNNPLNTGYSSRLGPDAGVFADFQFSSLFSLQPMVEYSSQGGKKDGFQAFPTPAEAAGYYEEQHQTPPAYLYANYDSQAKLNYLMIPVLAKFGFTFPGSPWRIYIDAGPFVSFLLNAHQVTTGSSEFYADPAGKEPLTAFGTQSFDNTQNIKDQLHSTDVGVEGNLGIAYKIKRSSIFIEGGGNYGFLNIQKGTANGKNETGAGTADIGYAYAFGK